MFRFLLESSSGPSKKIDPYLEIPQRILNISKHGSVFLEEPENDSDKNRNMLP